MTEEFPLPDPPVPPDCDLTGYDFMPLYFGRLLSSATYLQATDAEFRAALNLWISAWTQIPAGSLPADEKQLSALSGNRNAPRAWRKVKRMALSGFVKCSDGRLYHFFLASEALKAYEKRKHFKELSRRGNAKRWPVKQELPTDLSNPIRDPIRDPMWDPERESHTGSQGTGQDSISNQQWMELERAETRHPRTPTSAAHSIARAREVIQESLQARETAVPMPDHIREKISPPRPLASAQGGMIDSRSDPANGQKPEMRGKTA